MQSINQQMSADQVQASCLAILVLTLITAIGLVIGNWGACG